MRLKTLILPIAGLLLLLMMSCGRKAPVACYELSDDLVWPFDELTLHSDCSENAVEYKWDSPETGEVYGEEDSVTVSFDEPGIYPVRLTVYNEKGKSDEIRKDVLVGDYAFSAWNFEWKGYEDATPGESARVWIEDYDGNLLWETNYVIDGFREYIFLDPSFLLPKPTSLNLPYEFKISYTVASNLPGGVRELTASPYKDRITVRPYARMNDPFITDADFLIGFSASLTPP